MFVKTYQLPLIAAIALATSQAQAAPEIYGRLYLGAMHQTEKTTSPDGVSIKTDTTTLESGGSRIGFKGKEPLNDKLDIEYRLEYRTALDTDDKSQHFTPRNTWLGVSHKDYGTLRVGRILTPDDDIDWADQSYNYSDAAGTPFGYASQRANNAILYLSPKFNKDQTQFIAYYGMDEDRKSGGNFKTFVNDTQTSISRDFGLVGLTHEVALPNKRTAFVGATYTHAGSDFNALRGTVSYDVNEKLNLATMAQQVDYNSNNNELGAIVSAYYKINKPLHVYAQVGHTKNYGGYKDSKATNASLGAIYFIKDNLRAYGTTSMLDKKVNQQSTKVNAIEAGLRYDF